MKGVGWGMYPCALCKRRYFYAALKRLYVVANLFLSLYFPLENKSGLLETTAQFS